MLLLRYQNCRMHIAYTYINFWEATASNATSIKHTQKTIYLTNVQQKKWNKMNSPFNTNRFWHKCAYTGFLCTQNVSDLTRASWKYYMVLTGFWLRKHKMITNWELSMRTKRHYAIDVCIPIFTEPFFQCCCCYYYYSIICLLLFVPILADTELFNKNLICCYSVDSKYFQWFSITIQCE